MRRWRRVWRLMLPLVSISLLLSAARSLPRSLGTVGRRQDPSLRLLPMLYRGLAPAPVWAASAGSRTPQPRLVTEINDLAALFEQGSGTPTVTATNGGTASAQATVALTVSNFQVSASPSSVTVTPGQAANYTVSVTPQFGAYPSAVALTCRNLPSQARCSFSAPSVTPGSATATAALTISTTAASSLFRLAPSHWPSPGSEILSVVLIAFLGLGGFYLMLGDRRARVRAWGMAPGLRLGLGVVVVSLGLLALALSCGGGGGTPPVSNPGTPAGAYTVTITGTNGSLVQSTTTTLVVQ